MQKTTVLSSILIFVLGISLGAYIVYASPSSTFYISSGVYPHGLWTIEKHGTNYNAKSPYGQTPSYSGGTNFSTLFQKVINEVKTVGGRIFLKAVSDSYLVQAKISIPANTHGLEIYGEGFSTRLLLAPNIDKSMFDIGENCSRIVLRDMRLSGDSANNVNSHAIILNAHIAHSKFEDLYINEFAERGISGGGGNYSSCVFRRIYGFNCGSSIIYLKNAHSTTVIEDSVLGNNVEQGFPYLSSGVISLDTGGGVIIENVGVFCGRYGLFAKQLKNLRVVNLFPHVNAEFGIYFNEVRHSLVTNSLCYGNGQNATYNAYGVCLHNSTWNTINGVQTINNDGWFSSPFTDNAQEYGIRETGTGSDYNTILDCTAKGNTIKNIEVVGSSNTEVHDSWNGTSWIS